MESIREAGEKVEGDEVGREERKEERERRVAPKIEKLLICTDGRAAGEKPGGQEAASEGNDESESN